MKESAPTNMHQDFADMPLLVVDQNLSLFETYLVESGKKHLYANIKALRYSGCVATINFASFVNEATLSIIFDDDQIISCHIDKLSKGKKNVPIEQACTFLQKTTYDLRLKKLCDALNTDGSITFGTPMVRLYRDGTIENQNGRRLKISKSTDSLRIGFGKTGARFTDPNEIRISDKPRPFLQFDCFESKNTIAFHLFENTDAIRAIFEYFIER